MYTYGGGGGGLHLMKLGITCHGSLAFIIISMTSKAQIHRFFGEASRVFNFYVTILFFLVTKKAIYLDHQIHHIEPMCSNLQIKIM